MTFQGNFVINIVEAMTSQLLVALEGLIPASLDRHNIDAVPRTEGVYVLYHQSMLVYVGKAADLRDRLGEHWTKIGGRWNIQLSDMTFVCLTVSDGWTALAPEATLISALKNKGGGLCIWNGNGFGPHDPGRDRETTNKPSDGFDAQYPIIDNIPCHWIAPGVWNVLDLLLALKANLPYLLRYEVAKSYKTGHPDYNKVTVSVHCSGVAARDLLALIAKAVPGWQATAFPSHLIFYKENKSYSHGKAIW